MELLIFYNKKNKSFRSRLCTYTELNLGDVDGFGQELIQIVYLYNEKTTLKKGLIRFLKSVIYRLEH